MAIASLPIGAAQATEYIGVAEEYATAVTVELVTIQKDHNRNLTNICKTSFKEQEATFSELQSSLPKPFNAGTWLLMRRSDEKEKRTVVRCVVDNHSQTLVRYFREITRHVDRSQPIPLYSYYKYLGANHWLVRQDAYQGLATATYDELSRFATAFTVAEIASRLDDSQTIATSESRVRIVMLAHANGSAREKMAILEKIIVEPLKGEWPGQAENLDAILSAMLICDKAAGKERIESILMAQNLTREIRQKAIRSLEFGIAEQMLSITDFIKDFRSRLNDFYDLYPEIIELAYVCDARLDASDVVFMATNPKVSAKSAEESVIHSAVVAYYWTQEEAWRSEFRRLVSQEDEERVARLIWRRDIRKTPGPLLKAKLDHAIHRADDSVTCYLGSLISE